MGEERRIEGRRRGGRRRGRGGEREEERGKEERGKEERGEEERGKEERGRGGGGESIREKVKGENKRCVSILLDENSQNYVHTHSLRCHTHPTFY